MRMTHYQWENYFNSANEFCISKSYAILRENCNFHSHDFIEICYVSSGKGTHLVNEKEFRVTKGDLFIIRYNMMHTFFREIDDSDDLIVYNILFKPSFLDQILGGLVDFDFTLLPTSFLFHDIESPATDKLDLSLNVDEQMDFDDILNKIYLEFSLQPNGHFSMIRAYMIQFIIMIIRAISNKEISQKDTIRESVVINKILIHLKEHFSEKLNLNDIVLKSFFSKGYLCKVFKEATGMTMSEYIHVLRINEACSLLVNTDANMVDIALQVGFSDYKSYMRAFKKVTGKRPKDYRAEHTVSSV